MKVLICGSRAWTDTAKIRARMVKLPVGTEIIHGGARGADSIARRVAFELGLSSKGFYPDWEKYGKGAGHVRNTEMLNEKPDYVIAFVKGTLEESRGTLNCVAQAEERKIPTEIHYDR